MSKTLFRLRFLSIAFITLMMTFCFSCDLNRVYEKYASISNNGWEIKSPANFTIEIGDTSVLYDMYINIRHNETYPFQNIWLMIATKFPDGTNLSRRIEIMLASEDGKWYGENLGDIWDYRTLIQENASFTQAGTYTFSFEQNMRQDPLPGIMAVGLRIENPGIHKSASTIRN